MTEILAPAGDKNSVLAAVNAGANAVYLGLKAYSARSSAKNFDYENFEEISKYCHLFGVKVYVALNTLVKNAELEDFITSAVTAWNKGADALIISDVFLGKFLKENCPEIVLHLSTQAGVCNAYGARLAKEYGFSRVILARETAIEDIEEIAKIIETEVFVQGALCTCFSGQCYLSSFAGGNSGNRGKCKQPCRKKYSIDRDGFEESAYRLSLSDLSVGENIERLISAGVASFKIEGRMRRPEYVAAAVNYYKKLINGTPADSELSDLKRAYNRGNYTAGLAFGQDKNFISSAVQGHIGEYAGIVKVENSKYVLQTNKQFSVGDSFKVLRDGTESGGALLTGTVKNGYILSSRDRLKNGDKAFITTDKALNERLLSQKRLVPLKVRAKFLIDKIPEIELNDFTFYGFKPLESAVSRPLTQDEIVRCFKKVDNYPFNPEVSVETDGVFIPLSELNSLRRKVYSEYFGIISSNKTTKYSNKVTVINSVAQKNSLSAVIATDLDGLNADIGILKLNDYSDDCKLLIGNFVGEKFLYLPPYIDDLGIDQIKKMMDGFDGIYCDSYYGIELAKELNKKLFAGTGFNITNGLSLSKCEADYKCLSKELTVKEANELSSVNVFYLCEGGIKLMDLIYCPFEKKCNSCDMRRTYSLTDENGRKFPLRRYKTDGCAFEVYNCAKLAPVKTSAGKLIDNTVSDETQSFTRGHSVNGIY